MKNTPINNWPVAEQDDIRRDYPALVDAPFKESLDAQMAAVVAQLGKLPPAAASGQIAGNVISAPTDYTITFPAGRFTTAPRIVYGWTEGQQGFCTSKSITATGAVVTVHGTTAATSVIPRINWFAYASPVGKRLADIVADLPVPFTEPS